MVITDPAFGSFIFWLSTLASIPPLLFVLGQMHFHSDWYRRILIYPVMMFLWIGLAWSLTLALCDGLLHSGGAFIRTPKFRIRGRSGDWRRSAYRPRANKSWIGELCIAIYVCVAAWTAFTLNHGHLIPLVLSYVLAEVMLLGLTFIQSLPADR
jgi:hypothetical protein